MRIHGRLVLSALLVLVGGTGAVAQERQIGLKAGASLATLERNETRTGDEPYGTRTGITAGPFLVLPLENRFALQLEMLFTEKGGSLPLLDPAIVTGEVETRFKFHYMDLPALMRVKGPRLGSASLHVFAGPTLGVMLSAREQTAFKGLIAAGFEDKIGDMERFDLGATLGAGVEIQRAVFEVRYTHGLNDVVTDIAGARLSNRGLLITGGMRIF